MTCISMHHPKHCTPSAPRYSKPQPQFFVLDLQASLEFSLWIETKWVLNMVHVLISQKIKPSWESVIYTRAVLSCCLAFDQAYHIDYKRTREKCARASV